MGRGMIPRYARDDTEFAALWSSAAADATYRLQRRSCFIPESLRCHR